ncbi:Nce101p KNAG_0I00570 [Huiozyma naganishii CBS 8797]|uniref:Uncharacterized protein n=1 Tax=Huiozyma naganishii (strain ATCC MYA-139 / BCRC 22969 / CBS 8797 / KCTC 17520 / NBRC 10181 / NCYC 3082 / Yp74L-3) TaxID=1071383 RepID=J7RQ08_HUIN7|nr:hypothetical protein KNAG_0I00570 [Kazachstania naganishii CBS 8797]CCK71848.1 hypothetical protein KNAG_0I00570 [Kazachstania naganishii CBS 8797]
MTKHAPYLLGRIWDPIVAICIGTTSYYVFERRRLSIASKTGGSTTVLLSRSNHTEG